MSYHRVSIEWARDARPFTYESYSRDHRWYFDGVATPVSASAATQFMGNGELVDPEQAFVAGSDAPDRAALRSLHERAHRECFLANSVNCAIEVDLEPQWQPLGEPAVNAADD